MARSRKRKSDKGIFSEDQMKEAVKQVVEKGKSVRGVAKDTCQVFTNVEEKELEDFILESSKMCFGLTMRNLRKIAYETAVKNNLRMPDAWVSKGIAGKEWTFGFMKRHPHLSLRNPEACFLSRAKAFNKHNVNTFFDTLNTAMMRNPSFGDGSRVFNLDETGLQLFCLPRGSVSDRLMPTILNTTVGVDLMFATVESSSTNKELIKLDENTDFISPKEFIGYPKAKPRRENPNKRRRGDEADTRIDNGGINGTPWTPESSTTKLKPGQGDLLGEEPESVEDKVEKVLEEVEELEHEHYEEGDKLKD
ncbi:hypothetical protein ILUMI_27458 [Ignelater luminosus]|uniref:Uncharacterized protein n=1 Tax=Ignelater luminosus TaxID=2038154 RepID=A0A8K0C560_IGNLU|nr:hypothetical protein ILUMI_27458 [Ignelater luminosus]